MSEMNDNQSPTRLSAEIIAQLERLGCTVDSPGEACPARAISFGGEEWVVPEAYRQFVEDVSWPEGDLRGRAGDWDYWGLSFKDELTPFVASELGFGDLGLADERYLHIGVKDGGNYYLLLDLRDPRPDQPRLLVLDHDETIEGPSSYNTLLEVVSGLLTEAEQRDVNKHIKRLRTGTGDQKYKAAERLAELEEAAHEATDALIEALDDDYRYVPARACAALAAIGPRAKAAAPKLETIATSGEHDVIKNWRGTALETLGSIVEEPDSLIPLVIEIFNKPPSTREEFALLESATKAVISWGDKAHEALPAMLGAIDRRDRLSRDGVEQRALHLFGEEAIEFLSQLENPPEGFVSVLLDIASDKDIFEMSYLKVIEVLSDRAEAGQLCVEKFRDVAVPVIERGRPGWPKALKTLLVLDALPEELHPTVEARLTGDDRFRAGKAMRRLCTLGERARPLLPSMLAALATISPFGFARLSEDIPELVGMLGALVDGATLGEVTGEPHHKDIGGPKFIARAAEVLSDIGRPASDTLPGLVQHLGSGGAVGTYARRAVEKVAGDALVPLLIELVSDRSNEERIRVEAATMLMVADRHCDWGVVEAAQEIVPVLHSLIDDAESSDELREAAKKSCDWLERYLD